jgi:cell wall-associated NlpC family hydrolase
MLFTSWSRTIGVIAVGATLALPGGASSQASAPAMPDEELKTILARECTSLSKDRMYSLLTVQLAPEREQGITPEVLRIVEGVVKRTDFDGIAEEKTVEIIGLVLGAYRKGAPLEHLDEIFDVAYVKTVTVDRLAAAAHALKEFGGSDVPRDIYEEFVYHAIEDEWDPAAMPVLTRGLIYGVDRGLSPDKVALIIMLDVKNEERKNNPPEQIVLDAIRLVREKEPGKWRPVRPAERDLAAKKERVRELERRKSELDEELQQRERAFVVAQVQMKELREYPDRAPGDADAQKLNRDLEALLKRLQGEIARYQAQQRVAVAELDTTRKDVDRRQAARDRERARQREQELGRAQQDITSRGRQGRLDRGKLNSAVDRLLGTPYRFGGDSEHGIDCSAFTRRVYRSQGVELPRNSREQARVCSATSFDALATGDLVFFNTSINGVISHVGVYLGSGVFAHASSSRGVTKSSIRERYYVKRFVKGGRVFND